MSAPTGKSRKKKKAPDCPHRLALMCSECHHVLEVELKTALLLSAGTGQGHQTVKVLAVTEPTTRQED